MMTLSTILLLSLATHPSTTLAFTSPSLINIHTHNAIITSSLPTHHQHLNQNGLWSSSSSSNNNSNSNSNNNSKVFQQKKRFTATTLSVSASATVDDNDGKQGLPASIFSLVKACVGSGVLALPAGVAAIGDVSSALYPASLLIVFLGALSAYSFFMIGRISHLQNGDKNNNNNNNSDTKSLGVAWDEVVGENSSWIVSLSCFLTPLGAALTYSIILGDMLSALASSAGLTGLLIKRQTSILGITAAALYPLCHLKSLAALAPVSIIGVIGMLMTSLFMIVRSIPGGPYCAVTKGGGAFLSTLAPGLQPSFGIIGNQAFSPSILILVSMAATSFLAHFSAHEFSNGLRDKSLKRFGILTGVGFSITVLMNILVMSSGFCTFGSNCQGMILNNYSGKDIGATLCRLIVTISLIGSYPLFVRGIKSSFVELFLKGKEVSEKMNKQLTNGLLGGITAAALVLKDAGVMVSLTGAIMGSAIIYSFPSFIYLKLTNRLVAEGKMKKSFGLSFERGFNKLLLVSGGVLAILGTSVTLGII